MRRLTLYLVIGLIYLSIISSVCCAKELTPQDIMAFSDPMTENILLAMNDDDYARFSRDFDGEMQVALSEENYKKIIPPIKDNLGNYISKEIMSYEFTDDGLLIVIYKAKFSKSPTDVIVKSVFREYDNQEYIAGFWINK